LVRGSLDKFDYISTFQSCPWQKRHSISTVRKTPAIVKSVSNLLTALRHSVSPGRSQKIIIDLYILAAYMS